MIEVYVKLHHETKDAYLVSDDGEEQNAKWVPKSQVELTEDRKSKLHLLEIPEWLAKDKGFI